MNRIILIIVGAIMAAAVVVGGGIVLVSAITAGGAKPQYVASSVHHVRIVQQGAHSYDIGFDLPKSLSGAHDVTVEVTKTPDYSSAGATRIDSTVSGGRVQLPTTTLAAGDHFLWVLSGHQRIAATVTIPDMAPRVWLDGTIPTIEFDQAGNSSWSSYVDPEGKNVYQSANLAFGADAKPLAKNLAITKTNYRIDSPDATLPYYYLVFVGHGGDSTFVSSALFTTATQSSLTVDLRTIDGAPTYVIDGFLASRQTDDVERSYQLRVGNFNAGNPASTFMVDDTSTKAANGRFHFDVPAEKLDPGYDDLVVFLQEDGATLEWSLDASKINLSKRLVSGQTVFGMRRPEALQLTRLDLVYQSLAVTLTKSGNTAHLNVSGTFTTVAAMMGYQLTVKDTTGEVHLANNARSGRSFSYVVDLAQLDQSSVWYDVEFRDPISGASSPISTLSVRDMTQWVATDRRTYAFADYDGLLKVFFDAKPFVNSNVQLATINGVPSLVATGDLVGIRNSSALLRIRTGDGVVQDVANSSTTSGKFRFVFDVTKLNKPGTWFDVTFRNASNGKIDDFPSSAADLTQTLVSGGRTFGFRDFESELKVTYDLVAGTVDFTSVQLVNNAGVPTLRMEGALNGISASDAFLRIRTGAQVFDTENTSTTPGQAEFDFPLTSLTSAGTWYDVLVGDHTAGTLVDVPTAGVDLAQSLTSTGHAYGLHDFNSQLKVSFDDVSVGVTVSQAEIVNASGKPTLRVMGSVSGTTNTDVFLRIRSGAQTLDVPNTATAAGDALFEYDLSGLTQGGVWYDVLTGVTSTGVVVDLNQSVADLTQTLLLGGRTYGFHEYNGDLKVAFDNTPVSVTVNAATLVNSSGVPTLRVTGTYSGTVAGDLFLRVRTGAQTIDVPNTSSTAGQALFEYNLTGLTQPGTWYDLLSGVTSSGQLVDLQDSVADLSQTLQVGARSYGFHEYNHDLKVSYDNVATAFTIDSAEITDVAGVPTLHVVGTTVGLASSDVFLRIRSGAETINVSNSASTAGAAEFDYDLSGLTQASSWYDVLAGVTSSGSLVDLSDTTADLSQTVDLDGRHYAFHSYNSLLKVSYEDVAIALHIDSAQFTVSAGHPALSLVGTVTGTTNSDAFLRLQSGAQTVDLPNTATAPGTALFTYDLTGITQLDTEYALIAGITSTGSLHAVPSSTADLTDTLSMAGHLHSFRDSGGDLHLYVTVAPSAVDVTAVAITTDSGVPLLSVSGTVTGLGGHDDVFLRVRQGSTFVDVPNTSPDSGSALFEYHPDALLTDDYDLLIGETSTGGFAGIDSAVADLSQNVGFAGRTFGFHSNAGDLQLRITDTPAAVSVAQAQIVSVSGVPTLRVTGSVVGTGNTDAFLRINTGAQTVNVPNTSSVAGQALFEYDLRALTQQGTWYDLLTGVTSTGTLTDLASDPGIVDISQTAAAASKVYGFREWGGTLKVTFNSATAVITPTLAEIVNVSGVPTLRVTGTVTNTNDADLFLRIRTSSETFNVPNTATTEGQFQFAYDLSGLTKTGTWYDLLVGVSSTGTLTDLTPAVANMAQTITVANHKYTFQQFNNLLKVNFDDVSVVTTVTSAQLLTVSGNPTLRVLGTVTNTSNGDVFLRVRTGATIIDVPNAASTAGQLSFDFPLSGLTAPGTWYDVLIGVTSKGTLTDVPTSAADLTQTVANNGYSYSFQDFSSQLKVTYTQTLLGQGQTVRIDFGLNDGTNGHQTVSPDTNGNYWNNALSSAAAGAAITTAVNVPGLKTTANVTTTTGVTVNTSTTVANRWLSNGRATGGLLTPTAANLGDDAISTATEDYMFVQNSGTASLTLTGLDPYRLYDLKFFGTRITGSVASTGTTAGDVRYTVYSVTGNAAAQSAQLQTSGPGSGTSTGACTGTGTGPCYGNNATLASVAGMQPTTAGTLTVQVNAKAVFTGQTNAFGYLGLMEIIGGAALTPPPVVPAEVSRWVSQDAADPVAPNSVLFTGSSSIRRWESLTRDFADYNVIQRAWGGAYLSGVNDYAPWVVLPYDPTAIVLWAGTNDLRGGESPQTVLDNFRTFVNLVHTSHPTTQIFYISITPTPYNDDPANAWEDPLRIQTNSLIKAETQTNPLLHYIDVASYFENVHATDPTLFHSLYVDNLHLSRAGYAQWLSIVRPALAAVVPPNKTVTSNPATLQPGEKLLFDFGPSNSADGDPTNVDPAGNHWNNWTATSGGGLVNDGEHITGLVNTAGRNTKIGMTITGGFLVNGKQSGGLQPPNGPSTALLGDLGVATATEDYFYSTADNQWGGGDDDLPGGFMLTGLDPSQTYTFRFFGSRDSTETRVTEYAVYGTDRQAATLQTSGVGIGSNGTYNGNDSHTADITGVHPDAFGQVWVDVTLIQGSYAHLNAMEILSTTP